MKFKSKGAKQGYFNKNDRNTSVAGECLVRLGSVLEQSHKDDEAEAAPGKAAGQLDALSNLSK